MIIQNRNGKLYAVGYYCKLDLGICPDEMDVYSFVNHGLKKYYSTLKPELLWDVNPVDEVVYEIKEEIRCDHNRFWYPSFVERFVRSVGQQLMETKKSPYNSDWPSILLGD